MNKVILTGRVGTHPEFQTFDSGSNKVKFSLATRSTFKKNAKSDTDWHNIVAWNGVADLIKNLNLTKGAQVAIEGKLKPYTYKSKSGSFNTIVNVVVDLIEIINNPKSQDQNISQLHPHPSSIAPIDMADDDDDLPF